MAGSGTGIAPAGGFGATLRRDAWCVEILPVVIGLGDFGIYATLRAFFFDDGLHAGLGTLVMLANDVLLSL